MAANLSKINNHWTETVEPSVLEQYKSSTMWKGIIKATIDKMQIAENDAYELATILSMSVAPTGSKLDWLAGLVNHKRNAGETDENFLARITNTLAGGKRVMVFESDAGTAEFIERHARIKSGDQDPIVFDEAPATVFVYTPGGSQMKREDVRTLAPGGVLGVPAAALLDAKGNFICDARGNKILCVAQDKDIVPPVVGEGFLKLANGGYIRLASGGFIELVGQTGGGR